MKFKNTFTILSASITLLSLPTVMLAVATVPLPSANITNIDTVVDAIFGLIWPIFAAYAVVMFIVAGVQFLSARGDASEVAKARSSLLWGIAGVGVALLAFSIPFIIKTTLGV